MKNTLKICAMLAMLCVVFVFAQEALPPPEPATPAQELEVPAQELTLEAVPDTASEPAMPAQEETTAAEVVEAEPVAEPEPIAQQPPAPVEQQIALPIAKAPSSIGFHLGIRGAAGLSALRGHKALQSPSFGTKAIRLESAFSLGAGLAFAVEINELFSIAPELQYTWYRANGEFLKKNKTAFSDLNEAGVSLHSFELPILARFNFGPAYAEAGPQIGYNYYAKIYRNSEFAKPDVNAFAFGPSLGAGANINGILLGLRGHFGILEYAKNTKGYPWAAQVSVTHFFF